MGARESVEPAPEGPPRFQGGFDNSAFRVQGWGLGNVQPALTPAIFPLFGSAGSITAGWVSDRMAACRGPVLAITSVLLTGSVYLFSRIPGSELVWLMVALALVGFTLYGPYSLMAGTVAMDFGGQHASATASGIIDAVGAVGVILTGVGMGYLIDTHGWTQAFNIIISMSVFSMFLNFALWNLEPRQRAVP